MARNHIRVVDKDGPTIYQHEEQEVQLAMERKDEDEKVIGYALEVPVEGMKCVGRKGCGYDPLVVRLVDIFIDGRMMKTSMYPIDTVVSGQQKEWNGSNQVPVSISIQPIVKLGIPHYLCLKPRQSEEHHCWE